MKKWVRVALLWVVFVIFLAPSTQAQFAFSTWTDSVAITTTTTTLTATVPYYQITFYTDSVDVWIKWNTAKTWIRLFSGTPYSVGPSDKVTVIYVRTITGTGIFYTAGLKTSPQSTAGTF